MVKWFKRKTVDISQLKAHPTLAGVGETALRILTNRGFDTPEKVEKLLFSGIGDLHDPRLMKDAEKAVEIIERAIRNGEPITVYGDYDADGVGSTVLMTKLLRKAGGTVHFFTNNRFIHGYGICPKGVDDMLALYPETKLIVTVDNGISAHAGINYAKEKGLTVVVTDHHDPAETLPDADAIVDPKRRDCEYPFKGLCGAGVAFKLMLLLYWNMGHELETVYTTMDIVALSTVADVVPLVDENRIIVKKGLNMMESESRSVFRIFRQVTGVKTINAHHTIGMVYAPMINAIGRLDGDPRRAIEMFFEEEEEKIEETILYLKEVNERRKAMTVEQTEIAMESIEGVLDESTGTRSGGKGLQYVNVVYHPDFHEGIVGLIAGRLKEHYNRPFFVFTKEHGYLKGSGRGIDGFHLKEAMDKIKYLFKGYGGHAKACGLSLEEAHLKTFEEEINRLAKECLTEDNFQKVKRIEIVLKPHECSLELIDELKDLEPFGEAFPKPVLGIEDFFADSAFPIVKGSSQKVHYMRMGSEQQHLKLKCGNLDLIVWGMSDNYIQMGAPKHIKAIGYPDINIWQDRVTVQFIVDNDNIRSA
ncbi:single-stranded-DNA-specific exonuclease RecJ (plasmid) [Paenibacillus thiaminolyticus]|uniref:single-stranded-DNA-specific exonuclease RecJ n=1 Tax=Paenibacillus thiaminolyticus TaxID=49283 RepID=UPI00232EEB80|nr:single-stranded-DNA-specific exonuclease RecJ [Paenibacillus thiaminolyticus]WCF11764.1 single-stranded-DNA-specific exonuclease RecJ [Paenibacillus thiaminolyticus]